MADLLVQRISKDLDIPSYRGEPEESFARRVLYSAARFQVESYCFDDGQGGREGVRKQSITYRFNEWVRALGRIYPWCPDWFGIEGDGAAPIYNRLIEIGDLVPVGEEGLLRVSLTRTLPLTAGLSVKLGFYDASSNLSEQPRGVISGLATLVPNPVGTIGSQVMNMRWWEETARYLDWQEASLLGAMQYANAGCSRWSLSYADVWREEIPKEASFCLAKQDAGFETNYYAVEMRRGKPFAASIDWHSAEALFFWLRAEAGNPATARARKLDEFHYALNAPIGFIAPEGGRWIDAVTWPIENVSDNFDRITRAEAFGAIRQILKECDVELKEE